ncbi:hypothetical protein WICMUC_003171 [Wickerhamomyces mucosus]|uniref:SH3 domain-containing protein n=1 Tax=Wickerhamomyces mucosus TaxID=1378264 RepID=A0A9P8PNB6_9ASCO|nr:hypothetical protein WICMUC_003171 [Wickerhamomyces mucosus]
MEKSENLDDKIQCKVHGFVNDKEWINFKKSIVRVPQIFKQKINFGNQLEVDEEFQNFFLKFKFVSENLQDLETQIILYNNQIRMFLDHALNLGKAFQKILDPKLLNQMANEITFCQNIENSANEKFQFVHQRFCLDYNYKRHCLASEYCHKVEEAKVKSAQILNMIIDNVKEPISRLLEVSHKITQNIKEREFAILDVNKFMNSLESLQMKFKNDTLSLKQEQNMIRYEKDLHLSVLKYEQINNCFKRDLPAFFKQVSMFVVSIHKIFYFLQLSFSYDLFSIYKLDFENFEMSESSIKQNSSDYFKSLINSFHKTHDLSNVILKDLKIIKSKSELKYLQKEREINEEISSLFTSIEQDISEDNCSFCTALYSYYKEQEGDLSFEKGDRIRILDKVSNENWWRGELNGEIGIFPQNYVSVEQKAQT